MDVIRKCSTCGLQAHTIEEMEERFVHDKAGKFGYKQTCKSCDKARSAARYQQLSKEEKAAISKKAYAGMVERYTKEERRARGYLNHLRSKFGMSKEVYEELWENQAHKCGLCGISLEGVPTHVDHNHETNEVRAIVCHHCNKLLGRARDSKRILQNAIDYLKTKGQFGPTGENL